MDMENSLCEKRSDVKAEPSGVSEARIAEFWEAHPCGERAAGGMSGDFDEFFAKYDAMRYAAERHLLRCLDELRVRGKEVLEIGLGQGADSEQLIRRGAVWSGLELTSESIRRVRTRLKIRHLPYNAIKQGSVLDIPFPSESFDVVFSHGVLHHVPNIALAQREIHRVLRPGGALVVMLYAKYSLNYLVSIALLRRLGLALVYFFCPGVSGICGAHLANARSGGLTSYLRMSTFIHRNTDGPDNCYSKVYTLREVRRDFPLFRVDRAHKEFLHAPPLRITGLPGAGLLGWHLWVHMRPVAK